MISVEERELIRRAYFLEHQSLHQITKELHVARKAIDKVLTEAESYKLNTVRPAPLHYLPLLAGLQAERSDGQGIREFSRILRLPEGYPAQ